MAKPPDRSVKATTAKPAGKEVRRKNKRHAIAPPPATVELPLTAAAPPPTLAESRPPDPIEAQAAAIEPPSMLVEPAPEAMEPSPLLAEATPPDAGEPSPILIESMSPDASEPSPILIESMSPDAGEPAPLLIESTSPDAGEPAPLLIESTSPNAGEPAPLLIESTSPDAGEPAPLLAEATSPDAGEPPAAVADSPAMAEHAHEVLVRLSDEEHQALAAACAALAAVGQMVSIEGMIRTLVERWMAATRTATAPDVPAPAHPRMLDAVRAQLRWIVAQPLRRWHELRLALRRWTRALAA